MSAPHDCPQEERDSWLDIGLAAAESVQDEDSRLSDLVGAAIAATAPVVIEEIAQLVESVPWPAEIDTGNATYDSAWNDCAATVKWAVHHLVAKIRSTSISP